MDAIISRHATMTRLQDQVSCDRAWVVPSTPNGRPFTHFVKRSAYLPLYWHHHFGNEQSDVCNMLPLTAMGTLCFSGHAGALAAHSGRPDEDESMISTDTGGAGGRSCRV